MALTSRTLTQSRSKLVDNLIEACSIQQIFQRFFQILKDNEVGLKNPDPFALFIAKMWRESVLQLYHGLLLRLLW